MEWNVWMPSFLRAGNPPSIILVMIWYRHSRSGRVVPDAGAYASAAMAAASAAAMLSCLG
eukprot:837495-Pelagomonas_calceolata.AAC.1